MPENRRLFSFGDQLPADVNSIDAPPSDAHPLYFMQGVGDDDAIVDLTSTQTGALLTFVPPSKSRMLDPYASTKLRRRVRSLVKLLALDVEDHVKSQSSNSLMASPFTILQLEGDRADRGEHDALEEKAMSNDFASIKAFRFKRRSSRVKSLLDKSFDFSSRRCRQADERFIDGELGKATEASQKTDAKASVNSGFADVEASLSRRSLWETPQDERDRAFRRADSAADLIAESNALKRLKGLKRSRSPGVDGFTIERLISVFLGSGRSAQLRGDPRKDYAQLLKKACDWRAYSTSVAMTLSLELL